MWLLGLVFGCSSKEIAQAEIRQLSSKDLIGVRRTLIQSDGYATQSREITIEFTESGFGFYCGCNTNSGTYYIKDTRLFAKEIMSTEMYCFPPPFQGLGSPNQDEEFLRDFLFEGPMISYEAGVLTLSLEDVELTFGDASALPPSSEFVSFHDTIWLVDEFVNADASIIRLQDDSPSVVFSTMDTFTLNTGCNSGTGKFTVLSNSITLSMNDFTETNCDLSTVTRMDELLQKLFRSPELQVKKNGGRLILRNKKYGISLMAKPSSE